jgi:hypothetical protein
VSTLNTGEIRRRPPKRRKCHATELNRPGWLRVTTYVSSTSPCEIGPEGGEHHVTFENMSPLPYRLTIEAECVTQLLSYRSPTRLREVQWQTGALILGRGRSGTTLNRLQRTVYGMGTGLDEQIRVTVSWKCVPNPGSGVMDPLSIAVDVRQTAHR